MRVEPYLSLDGRCEAALAFYQKALGAKLEMMMRFKEAPDPSMIAPGTDDKIMHASILIGETRVMATDGHCNPDSEIKGVSLSIMAGDIEEAERFFNALSDGATITMPLEETFWSPRFGMLTDKFGVHWMINTEPAA